MNNKEQIKKIVDYQFGGITNLTKEAYADSLESIAEQILELDEEKA